MHDERFISGIFNYCGFDMVYFDGGEDVEGDLVLGACGIDENR